MTGDERERTVLEAVVTLVDSLLDDFDVVELLTDLTERSAQLLDVASAGLLLAGPDQELHLMTATSSRTYDLELFQVQSREGPCLESYRTGRTVSVADVRVATHRWPNFAVAALDGGFTSVHAIPMRAAGLVLGTLGLFGTTPGELNAPDLAVGQALAHVASVAILQEHAPSPEAVPPRLRNTLNRQIAVEQAKGFVADRLDLSIDESIALLRAYARRRGQHLSDLCRALASDRTQRGAILAGLTALHDTMGHVAAP